jgi:hypothetical protein
MRLSSIAPIPPTAFANALVGGFPGAAIEWGDRVLRVTLQFHHLAVARFNLAHRLRLTLARPVAAIE